MSIPLYSTFEQSLQNCMQAHEDAKTKAVIPYKSYLSIGGSIPTDRTQEGYLQAYGEIGWLHAVIFRIALGCSEVKWTLFNVTNRDKPKQIYDHPILSLLHLVNPFQTSNEFIALDTLYQELVGESFWALNPNGLGEPAEIILPYPHKMSVVPAKAFPFVKGYVYGVGNEAVPFDINEIIHFKYPNPLNQYRGLGQAQAIGIELDSEQYSSQWIRQFFYNSARPDGVIQFDYNLSDEQFEKLKKQWSEKYKGVSKAHQVALLEGGGKYLQIQNSVKDMDFPNLKLKNRDSILGVVGMPLSVMGISENVNKANAEAGDYTFARWIVKPRLDWKVAKLQEQLIPKFRNSKNLQLGFEEVVPQTIEQKMLLAESGIRAGYLTINEARKLRGLDPLPNGDVLLVPLNLIPTPISGEFSIPAPKLPEEIPPEGTPSLKEPAKSKGLTPDQKKLHWENYAKTTERQELVFKKVFNSVFNEQKNQVIEQLEKTGKLPDSLDDTKTAQKFQPAIELVYHSAFEDAVPSKTLKQLDDIARTWILHRSLALAKAINMTTMDAIRKALAEGFAQGESIQQLSKRIEGYFEDNSQYRAEMVARTEVISASNEGALHRYELEGIDKSEFYPSPDACEVCVEIAQDPIYVTKDASGIIPVHPNCRCVFLPVV